jgi:hypothetical protein
VVVQTAIVAAVHISPLSPLGIVKFNTASEVVQLLVTEALVHGLPVVVVHTVTVAASHFGHLILLPSGLRITTQYFVGSSVDCTTLNLL